MYNRIQDPNKSADVRIFGVRLLSGDVKLHNLHPQDHEQLRLVGSRYLLAKGELGVCLEGMDIYVDIIPQS